MKIARLGACSRSPSLSSFCCRACHSAAATRTSSSSRRSSGSGDDAPPPKLADSADSKEQAAGQPEEAGENVDEAERRLNDAVETQDPDKLDDARTSRPADPRYPATKAALRLALGRGATSAEVKAALGELKGAVAAGLPSGVDDSNFKRDLKRAHIEALLEI